MRNLQPLEKYRVPIALPHPAAKAYKVPIGKRVYLAVVSVDGNLEHVSVSHRNPKVLPSWDEMCAVKDLFFGDEEEVYQIHPPKSQYANLVENCLHLWRPLDGVLISAEKAKGKKGDSDDK